MLKPKLPSAYNLISLDCVDSTNAEARRQAKLGEAKTPDGTLIWAKEQTCGYGRRKRFWYSPPGNLYCSLVLRPGINLTRAAEFSFIAALAVFDTLGSIGDAGHQVHLKWPNDILLNQRKVAGLLLETETRDKNICDWIILGLGMNINIFPDDTEFPATSLLSEGWDATEIDVLEFFCRHFLKWTNVWMEDGFSPIRKNWLWHSYGKGSEIKVRIENKTLYGVFEDLDEDGSLIVRTNNGLRKTSAGDVFFSNSGEA
jgi:BirA family biotin operon repressor/biotin-[acetyl-CoA-carboxylase] ligase